MIIDKIKNKEDIGFYPKDILSNILKFFTLQFCLYFNFTYSYIFLSYLKL